eukprot:TRINITY_DN2904_c0_g1_i1.p1 TRINITY_DN2904_c0_g1~~TRINITY_DN2904_c0_g1_i1.p1  ORF type:complete len:281 (-),score=49.56 TRINITY_DN2904_c0_g1_i1:10-852(-)
MTKTMYGVSIEEDVHTSAQQDGEGMAFILRKRNLVKNWHVAYHGTDKLNVDSIMEKGLALPGTLVDGKEIKVLHGSVGAKCAIFVSPSIEYSSHWVYTKPEKIGNEYLYCVLQVRVKPESFKEQGNTLWKGGWADTTIPFDTRFGAHQLEWVVTNPENIRVTGLMVKKEKVNPETSIKERFAKNKAVRDARQKEIGTAKGLWYWNCAPTGGSVLLRTGPWQPYSDSDTEKLETAYKSGQSHCYIGNLKTDVGTNAYWVDFSEMEQKRCDNLLLRRAVKRE